MKFLLITTQPSKNRLSIQIRFEWITDFVYYKKRPNLMKDRTFYYFFSFSALLLILSSEHVGGGSNITFPVSVLMKYILLSNNFLKKLMELFNIQIIPLYSFYGIYLTEFIQTTISSTSSCLPHPLCTNEH